MQSYVLEVIGLLFIMMLINIIFHVALCLAYYYY